MLYQEIRRNSYPTLNGEVVSASPLFIEMVERILRTGRYEVYQDAVMQAGALKMPPSPAVVYRSDREPPSDWAEKGE